MSPKLRLCREADREANKLWRLRNPEKVKESNRKSNRKYREKNRAALTQAHNQWAKANPEKQLNSKLKVMHGITLVQYNALLDAQTGVCAICSQPSQPLSNGKVYRLSVDHCHKTNVVRGLLCNNCNSGLGYFGDDPARLEQARLYLLSYSPS